MKLQDVLLKAIAGQLPRIGASEVPGPSAHAAALPQPLPGLERAPRLRDAAAAAWVSAFLQPGAARPIGRLFGRLDDPGDADPRRRGLP
jgi:hypothetical protein